MRPLAGRLLVAVLTVGGLWLAPGRPAQAQWSFDARRLAMGGALLDPSILRRYNPAYRPVRAASAPHAVIPVPLGLLQVTGDQAPSFDPNDPSFNVFELANLVLYPPVFLELNPPTIPDSSTAIELFVGLDSLQLNLEDADAIVPEDDYTLGALVRPFDLGFEYAGVRVGIAGFVYQESSVAIDDTLGAFLNGAPAEPNTTYGFTTNNLGQAGIAPSLGLSVRVPGVGPAEPAAVTGAPPPSGLYVGAVARYYLGLAYGLEHSRSGFVTGNPVSNPSGPANAEFESTVFYQTAADGIGTGFGIDLGAAFYTGAWELGLGAVDLGGTSITWEASTEKRFFLDDQNVFTDSTVARGIQRKAVIPMSVVANASYHGPAFQVGASFLSSAHTEEYRVAAEKWLGSFALRGGIGIDARRQFQLGWGGGVRLGAFGFDIAFVTHSATVSGERGLRLATSVAVY